MRKTIALTALGASLLTGGAAAVAFSPTASIAQSSTSQTTPSTPAQTADTDRDQWMTGALSELVNQGVITQEQADAVAAKLREARPPHGPGRGHKGPGLDVAAATIGIDEETLRQELMSGKTLAQVAEEHGVSTQSLIDAMVADLISKLDQAVTDGKLTQQEADEKKADATERITAMVNGQLPAGGPPHRGPRWGD